MTPDIPGAFLDKELIKPDERVAAIEERDEADHELLPWTEADWKRLGLKPLETLEEKPQPEKGPQKAFRVYRGGKPRAVATSA